MLLSFALLSSISAASAAVIAERVAITPRVEQPDQPLVNDACFNPVNRPDEVVKYPNTNSSPAVANKFSLVGIRLPQEGGIEARWYLPNALE